jgi:effector-binding domain-containing protein
MVEKTATRPAATPQIVELPERQAAVVRVQGTTPELPVKMGEAFEMTARAIRNSGAAFAGDPFARYHGFGDRIDAEVGFPFTGVLQPTERVHVSSLPGGRAVITTHRGPYEGLGDAWARARAWIDEHELSEAGVPWECYLTGPDEPGPPVTEIVFPVR